MKEVLRYFCPLCRQEISQELSLIIRGTKLRISNGIEGCLEIIRKSGEIIKEKYFK